MSDLTPTVELTGESILEAGRKRRIEEVPYMGGKVYAYGFKRPEAKAYWKACRDAVGEGGTDQYADERLVQRCIRDSMGKNLFTEDQLLLLADMNTADFGPLIEACLRVNGMGEIGRAAIAKNSSATRTDDS